MYAIAFFSTVSFFLQFSSYTIQFATTRAAPPSLTSSSLPTPTSVHSVTPPDFPIHQHPNRILTSPCHETIPDHLSARGLFV